MQFMITWEVPIENWQEALAGFSQLSSEEEAAMMGSEIKLLGRWHDLIQRKGVCILESENAEAVAAYAMKWNSSMHMKLSVVVSDERAKALGSSAQPDTP